MGASEHVALESESREVVASLGPRLTPTPPVVFDVLMMRHDVLVAMAVSCVYLYFFSIFLSLVFLCFCAGQILFGYNKFVSVIVFS